MFDEKVIITEQFPLNDSDRKNTDVCCTFIGGLFAFVMFVTALICHSPDKYESIFNTERENSCAAGYMHYIDIEDENSRVCVNACPHGYGVTEDNICVPFDEELQAKYYSNTNIMRDSDHEGFKKTVFFTFMVALGMAIMWMVFVLALPKAAPYIAAGGAALSLALVAIFSSISGPNFWGDAHHLKIFVIVVCVILIFVVGAFMCSYEGQLKFQAVILKYANIFLFENSWNFVYIPLFLLFTFGLFCLILFQHRSFASQFATDNNPWRFTNGGVWGVLNILEFIWGMQFLRDAFNFLISGSAVQWYWTGQTGCWSQFHRLICRHWGSVVAGSFLNAFFEIPTLIIEALTCRSAACCSKAGSMCENSCNPLTCFFQLIRTDAYSYINLSGIPFCNSSRICNHLCHKSGQYLGDHSAIRHYRLLAHIFLVALVTFMTQWILNYRVYMIGFWHLSVGVVLIYGIVTWFIDIHTAAAEGLQISYLTQLELEEGYKYMRKIRPSVRGELLFLDAQQKLDGNC